MVNFSMLLAGWNWALAHIGRMLTMMAIQTAITRCTILLDIHSLALYIPLTIEEVPRDNQYY